MNKTETSTASLWLAEDGIIWGVFKDGSRETLETAKENAEVAGSLAGDRRVPVLIDMSAMKMISKEARAHYASADVSAYSLAQALITKSPISRVIGNFFLGLNKPPHPVRLFTSESDALAWLKEIRG